jgi:hypothetical protein
MMAIDFEVVFVPGKKNTLPDGLSRFPILGPSIYDADTEQALSVTQAVSERPVHFTISEGWALLESRTAETELPLSALQQPLLGKRSSRVRQPRVREPMEDWRVVKRAKQVAREAAAEQQRAGSNGEPAGRAARERQPRVQEPVIDWRVADHARRLARQALAREQEVSSDEEIDLRHDSAEVDTTSHEVVMEQSNKSDKAEAREVHKKVVNSKVSRVYDTAAASRLAHAKILAEQRRDPKCKKILALLATEKGQGAARVKQYFFQHEDLLMRRFVPLEPEVANESVEQAENAELVGEMRPAKQPVPRISRRAL